MSITRRDLVKSGVSAAVLLALPRPLLARLGGAPEPVPPIEDPRLKALALRALDAARGAGASYADVRLTHTRTRQVDARFNDIEDGEVLVAGARALVSGYWGFAASPVWSPEEMVRLGREAVHQARVNALGGARAVELASAPPAEGHWTMPVQLDPFEVSPFEILDLLNSHDVFVQRTPGARVEKNVGTFVVQEKAFASSDGSYCTQRTYRSAGEFVVSREKDGRRYQLMLDCLTPAGLGWELYRAERLPLVRPHSLRDAVRQLLEEIEEDMTLPVKPVEVGRHDAALDAPSVSRLLGESLGRATELDRALGYEANAGGTSFLGEPATMLGSFQVGAPLLTVTADRSEPGAVATVKWDDEGVTPDVFPLVKDGVLTDYQTTRESATWLGEYYRKVGRPVRSHGCANAPSAVDAPLHHSPNLVLTAGPAAHDFEALVGEVGTGIAVKSAAVDMDFQSAGGLVTGRFYQVKGGKRVALIAAAGVLFRTPELWKGLVTLGGPQAARRYGMQAAKGEPPQATHHSVTAVPVVAKQLTVIDPLRKA